jgi:hypothetical protein
MTEHHHHLLITRNEDSHRRGRPWALKRCRNEDMPSQRKTVAINSLFVWLVVDGWCWFVLSEKYC